MANSNINIEIKKSYTAAGNECANILLLTIEPGEDERTDCTGIFGAGTNDFITKPVDESDLLSRLQQNCRHTRTTPG